MSNEIIEINNVTDPFDEALEDKIILDDVYFSASRDAVTLDGMQFSFIKPPYMNFDDHIRVKRKLKEAFLHHEFLLIYGYSGAGKSTVLTQFHEKYPYCIFLIKDFTSLSPSNRRAAGVESRIRSLRSLFFSEFQLLPRACRHIFVSILLNMTVKMGECIGLPLKQRSSEILVLQERLKAMSCAVPALSIRAVARFTRSEYEPQIHSRDSDLFVFRAIFTAFLYCTILICLKHGTPICICDVPKLYNMLYDSRRYDKYCSLITRLDEYEMKGMRREDAGNYLNMVAEKENLKFTYPAQQALIRIALCTNLGGIHAFTTIIGRSIPTARGVYYMNKVGRIPDNIPCVRPASPDGKTYPGAELVRILPVTPEPVIIDEKIVSKLLGEYKSHFPKEVGLDSK